MPLNKINVLIGSNGVGKSNFISFFELAKAIIAKRFGVYTLEKDYSDDYSAAIDLLKTLVPEFENGINVQIKNWQGIDEKSKDFLEALSNSKMIILGGK